MPTCDWCGQPATKEVDVKTVDMGQVMHRSSIWCDRDLSIVQKEASGRTYLGFTTEVTIKEIS